MSNDTSLRRVFRCSRTKDNDRLVLLAIAHHADESSAPLTMEALARLTNLCRRTIGHRIDALARSGELAVYPRPGKPHDYVVCSGLRPSAIKQALRDLAAARGLPPSELRRVRKQFHTLAASRGVQPDSQRGVQRGAQQVRKQVHTPAQESESVRVRKKIKTPATRAHRKPNPLFDAVAAGSFDIPSGTSAGQLGGRIGKILSWLRNNAPGQTPQDIRRFYDWYAGQYPRASAPRDPGKFGEHYLTFMRREREEAALPWGPLVTRPFTDADLDRALGLA